MISCEAVHSYIRHDPNIKWPITGCLPLLRSSFCLCFHPDPDDIIQFIWSPAQACLTCHHPAPRDESCHEASDWSGWGNKVLSLVKSYTNNECAVITSCERRQFDPVYPELSRASHKNFCDVLYKQHQLDIFSSKVWWNVEIQIVETYSYIPLLSLTLSLHCPRLLLFLCCCSGLNTLTSHIMSHSDSEQPQSRTHPVTATAHKCRVGAGWAKLEQIQLFLQ